MLEASSGILDEYILGDKEEFLSIVACGTCPEASSCDLSPYETSSFGMLALSSSPLPMGWCDMILIA
jgi:hypothetical protein